MNPDYDYEEDGVDTDDFVPFTCSIAKEVELPAGKLAEAEYLSKFLPGVDQVSQGGNFGCGATAGTEKGGK